MRIFKRIVLALIVIFLLMQLYRPGHDNPPVDQTKTIEQTTSIPPNVQTILSRSCNDCHSSKTTWPWYSHVAPVSWIVAKHVVEGREMLDFSQWANQPPSSDERSLICDAVTDGRMPLPEYTVVHRNAKLSKQDVALICNWANGPNGPVTSLQVGRSK